MPLPRFTRLVTHVAWSVLLSRVVVGRVAYRVIEAEAKGPLERSIARRSSASRVPRRAAVARTLGLAQITLIRFV